MTLTNHLLLPLPTLPLPDGIGRKERREESRLLLRDVHPAAAAPHEPARHSRDNDDDSHYAPQRDNKFWEKEQTVAETSATLGVVDIMALPR